MKILVKNSIRIFCVITMIIFVISMNNSCISEQQQEKYSENLNYIYWDSLSHANIIEENIQKCKFVKLQTTDECLIKNIKKIEFDDGLIFIRDLNEKIFVFSQTGSFLRNIGTIGTGPDEQLSIFDFYLNTDEKLVNIVDIYKNTIFKFDYSGNLLAKEKYDKDTFLNAMNFTLLENNCLLLTFDNSNNSLYNYGIVSPKKKEVTKHLEYLATGRMSLSFSTESKIAKTGGETFLLAFLSDTIYKYNCKTKSIVSNWVFKGKLKNAVHDDFKNNTYELGLEAMLTARNNNISSGIMNLYAIQKYIHFTFSYDKARYRVFYDMATNRGYYNEVSYENIYTSFGDLVATTNDAFVCVFPMDKILQNESLENEELNLLLNNSLEDDNPILAFYYFN